MVESLEAHGETNTTPRPRGTTSSRGLFRRASLSSRSLLLPHWLGRGGWTAMGTERRLIDEHRYGAEIAGHARGIPRRIESSKDSDFLIGCAVGWAAGEGTAYAGVRGSVCIRSDGQPATPLFHPPPSEPDLQDFQVSGSPVIRFHEFSMSACRLPYSLPPDRPVPLRHVSGFPGRRLLRGLRRRRARAP
jgi:hypothetical protein